MNEEPRNTIEQLASARQVGKQLFHECVTDIAKEFIGLIIERIQFSILLRSIVERKGQEFIVEVLRPERSEFQQKMIDIDGDILRSFMPQKRRSLE